MHRIKTLFSLTCVAIGLLFLSKAVNAQEKSKAASPLAATEITVPDGFKVELLYSVPKDEEGSWVCLTNGPDGTLIASDQGGKGLFQIAVDDEAKVRKLPVKLSSAQGLLWHDGGLYVNRNGGKLYHVTDSDNDGELDKIEELPSANGGGEHGNHAVILAEDKQNFYVVGGNHTPLPPISGSRVQSWDEDLLLSRQWDARGHARGRLAPGGWVTKFDPKTKKHVLYCIGFRNEYDVALNGLGDMFTFDADMEWDMGMPWYRPTRICFVTSGADYGWRSGTGKWPDYYEDSLPSVVDIGPGSPTGVVAGLGAKFPAKYQHAIFALDWTFGTIYAIHLEAKGAGYTGTSEPFCFGAPLPVTDAIVGQDGAMYFTVGGRGTQSGLYRISYTGSESTAAAELTVSDETKQAQKIRRELEKFHDHAEKNAVSQIWKHLGSKDRFIRNAARVALESQNIEEWAGKVFSESDIQTRITAAVALARSNKKEYRAQLNKTLLDLNPAELPVDQTLGLLRAYSLSMIRLGTPSRAEKKAIVKELRPLLPHDNGDVNTELVRVLVRLEDASIIGDVLTLMEDNSLVELPQWSALLKRNARYGGTIQAMIDNHPPSRQINYALMLRNLRRGWTLEQRKRYFQFLNSAAKFSGGASYPGFLTNIREEALANCSNDERAALASITGEDFNPVPDFEITPPKGPGKKWTVEQAVAAANRGRFPKASFENGRNLFFATTCGKCHRYAGLGGGVGPDLTSIPNKFDTKYLIESIVDPSKVISDQYSSSTVILDSGKTLTGIVIEDDDSVTVYPSDVKVKPTKVPRAEILEIAESKTSQMPVGLLDKLSDEELRDLIAYLISGGDPKSKVYGKR